MKVNNEARSNVGVSLTATPTGLFISGDKSYQLIYTIQNLLANKYQVVARTGPRMPNNTVEIVLFSQQSSAGNLSEAKHLVEKYLKMINELETNGLEPKMSEVIELDVDENSNDSCIVLDNSVNETVPAHTNLSSDSEKVTDLSKHDGDNISNSIKYNRDHSNLGVQSRIVESTKVTDTQAQKKRKASFNKDESFIEIIDDDIIILDDSFPPLKKSSDRIENNGCKSFVDLTESFIPEVNDKSPAISNEINLDTSSDFGNIKVNQKSGLTEFNLSHIANKVVDFLSSNSSSHKLSSSVAAASSSASVGSSTGNGDSSTKRKSLLTYKRPAHLVVPLTKASQGAATMDTQSNIYNPNAGIVEKKSGLRPIIIDGNNVAVGHGKGEFSLKGLEICINYFEKRGHRQIKAFVPHYRKNKSTHEALTRLERHGTVVTTPSRKVNGKMIASYDDRYIVQYAAEVEGVIVSSDNFRDLLKENESWRETIEKRLLMFTWVDNLLMFPQDPLGKDGPSLDKFLSFPE